jgi:hypothetical protein
LVKLSIHGVVDNSDPSAVEDDVIRHKGGEAPFVAADVTKHPRSELMR